MATVHMCTVAICVLTHMATVNTLVLTWALT